MLRSGALAFTLGLTAALAVATVPSVARADDLGFSGCNSKPTKTDTADAKRSYERGKKMFDERDRGAIDLFRSAYLADCTKHELLVVLSFAYQSDGQLKEALAASELYMQKRGSSLSAEDRHTVEERIALLKQKRQEQQDAAAAATKRPPPPDPDQPQPRQPPKEVESHRSPYPWVLVGGGAASVVTGAIFLPISAGNYPPACHDATLFKNGGCDDIDGKTGPKSVEQAERAGRAMGLKRAGVVMLAAGGAAVVGGLVWLAIDITSKPSTTGRRIIPLLSPTSVGVAGVF